MRRVYLCIPYIDRIGIVYDITVILTRREINIISMEVEEGRVFLECQTVSAEEYGAFMQERGSIPGVQDIEEISCMPAKERAEQLDAILTSVHDGILAVNHHGKITQCNPAAAGCSD